MAEQPVNRRLTRLAAFCLIAVFAVACKPDPEPVLEALRRLRADRSSATMVGDGLQDIRAGKAAGIDVPAQAIESAAVVIRPPALAEADLAARLRIGDPGVVPRVHDGEVWLDLRTVFPDQDDLLVATVVEACVAAR